MNAHLSPTPRQESVAVDGGAGSNAPGLFVSTLENGIEITRICVVDVAGVEVAGPFASMTAARAFIPKNREGSWAELVALADRRAIAKARGLPA